MEETRLDDVKVLSDVALADDDLAWRDGDLLHGAEHAGLLLVVEIAEDKVVGDGGLDSAELVLRLWIHGGRLVCAAVDGDGLCADGGAAGKDGRGRGMEIVAGVVGDGGEGGGGSGERGRRGMVADGDGEGRGTDDVDGVDEERVPGDVEGAKGTASDGGSVRVGEEVPRACTLLLETGLEPVGAELERVFRTGPLRVSSQIVDQSLKRGRHRSGEQTN